MADKKFTRQELELMTPQQLQATAASVGVEAPQAGGGALGILGGALRGGLQGFQGREVQPVATTTGTDLGAFAQKERIKKLIGEEFKQTPEEKLAEGEQKAVSDIQTKAAFKGISVPTEATLQQAQAQVATGLQEQVERKRQLKIKDSVVKEQNKLSDIVGDIQIVEGDIESLLNTFLDIPSNLKGPIDALRTAPFRAFQTQGSAPAVEYEDTKQFFLSNIARKLGGERGVLTDRDVERVEGLLPKLKDTDVVAQGKMRKIREFISRRTDEHRERTRTKVARIKKGEGVSFDEQEVDTTAPLEIFGIEQVGE